MVNSVVLVGRLVRDPRTAERAGDGPGVCEFRLAVGRSRDRETADFVDVSCFGALAELCAGHLQQGRLVGVTGRLRHSEWETDSGRRQKLDVVADQVDFLDAPAAGRATGPDSGGGSGERRDRQPAGGADRGGSRDRR